MKMSKVYGPSSVNIVINVSIFVRLYWDTGIAEILRVIPNE